MEVVVSRRNLSVMTVQYLMANIFSQIKNLDIRTETSQESLKITRHVSLYTGKLKMNALRNSDKE